VRLARCTNANTFQRVQRRLRAFCDPQDKWQGESMVLSDYVPSNQNFRLAAFRSACTFGREMKLEV
jgi:hypothetical protein